MNTPALYRKTSPVEAMQWLPDDVDAQAAMFAWMDSHQARYKVFDTDEGPRLGIASLESGDDFDRHYGAPGCYVAYSARGRHYIIAEQVMDATYELLPEATADEVVALAVAVHAAWRGYLGAQAVDEHLVDGQNALVPWEQMPEPALVRDLAIAQLLVPLLAELYDRTGAPADPTYAPVGDNA